MSSDIVAIFYPFSQFCEITISLLSLQKQPNAAPNLFQRGVEYGKYVQVFASQPCPSELPPSTYDRSLRRHAATQIETLLYSTLLYSTILYYIYIYIYIYTRRLRAGEVATMSNKDALPCVCISHFAPGSYRASASEHRIQDFPIPHWFSVNR